MRIRSMALTLCLILFSGVFFISNAEKSIAVMNMRSEQIGPTDCIVVTNYLTTELQRIPGYRILAWDDVTSMLEHQAGTQALGACDDDECLAEIGGALGVDYILAGDIGSIGDRYLMNLKLININRAATERRASTLVEGNIGLLMDRLPAMVGEILEIETAESHPEVKAVEEPMELSEEPDVKKVTPIAEPAAEKDGVRFSLAGGFNFSNSWYHIDEFTGNTLQSYGFTLSPGLKFSRSRLNLEFTLVAGDNTMDARIPFPTFTSTVGAGLVWYLETWRIADIITIAPGLGAGFWYTEDEIDDGRIENMVIVETAQFAALYLRVKIGRGGNSMFIDVGQIIGGDNEVDFSGHEFYRVPPIMQLRAGYERTF